MKKFILLGSLLALIAGCSTPKTAVQTKSVKETIPLTMANLRGHQSLYNEGWFVVSSSDKALKFAKKHGVDNAHRALVKAVDELKKDTQDYTKAIASDLKKSLDTTKDIFESGTQRSKDILKKTHEIGSKQFEYAKSGFSGAWESLIKGNISLAQRTEDDRKALAAIPGNYFNDLKEDFSNLGEIAASITRSGSEGLSKIWRVAFEDASKSFLDAYEASGEEENSLGGLIQIMYGYLKALFHGIVKPTTKSVVTGTVETGKKVGKLIYLPVGATISVVGHSVESLGLTLYYSASVGVKVVAPTVEAGFLTALSMLSLGTTPLTYVGGSSLGLVNQVGSTLAAPVAGTTQLAASTTYDTAKWVTYVSYDVVKGSSKIFFNEAASGIVLGYNALTALPTHALLAASDAVFFLAWDGPRLVVAMAKGEVSGKKVDQLPVGTVVDLKALKKEKGVDVEVISEDYDLVEEILHRLPSDVKVK